MSQKPRYWSLRIRNKIQPSEVLPHFLQRLRYPSSCRGSLFLLGDILSSLLAIIIAFLGADVKKIFWQIAGVLLVAALAVAKHGIDTGIFSDTASQTRALRAL